MNLIRISILALVLVVAFQFTATAQQSDDFHTSALNTNVWTFVNPRADSSNCTITGSGTSNAFLRLYVQGVTDHDVWGSNNAPRIMQTISDVNFTVEAKFQSIMATQYQIQGIIVEQNESNYLRADFVRDNSGLRIFSATTSGGSSAQVISTYITNSDSLWVRVNRTGSSWTVYYSFNGTSFTSAGSYSFALTVSKVGVFAGNAVNGSAPAFTCNVDYFFNTASPISPEDPTTPGDAPTIATHPSSQSVTVGQSATFTVSASGTSPFSYQWQKNSANISGATNSSYTTPSTVSADSGSLFRCIVTNTYGSATSNVAILNVHAQAASNDLQVNGNLLFSSEGNRTISVASSTSLDGRSLTITPGVGFQAGSGGNLYLSGSDAVFPGKVYINGGISSVFPDSIQGDIILNQVGNVGIGTSDPGDNKLAVNGKIKAKEILVDTSGWADYVFDKNYRLLSLEELEHQIKEYKRLPGIPSAEEAGKSGVNLAAFQTKLLQKIEEMALYLIDLKKQNDHLKRRVNALESR